MYMGGALQSIGTELASSWLFWLLSILVAGVVTISKKQGWTWNERVFYGLGAFAFMLIIFDLRVSDFFKPLPPAPPTLEERVRSFLNVPGYKVEKRSSSEDKSFVYGVSVAQTDLIIFSNKDDEKLITIRAYMGLNPETKQIYASLSEKEKKKFRAKLALKLLDRQNVEFNIDMPNNIRLSRYVYYSDSLSQTDFLHFIFDTQNAIKTAQAFLATDLLYGTR